MDQQALIKLITSRFKGSRMISLSSTNNKVSYFRFMGTPKDVDNLIPLLTISGFEFNRNMVSAGSLLFSCTAQRLDLLRPLHAKGITNRIKKKFPGMEISMCGTYKGIRYSVKPTYTQVHNFTKFLDDIGITRVIRNSKTISFYVGGNSRLVLGEYYATKNAL